MGFPKVKGGTDTQGGYGLPVKNRAKFVKKVSVPSLEKLQEQSSRSVPASKVSK